jgi:predicted RNA-binding Zn-ribbon protein involved in translation (DUF1610 family)
VNDAQKKKNILNIVGLIALIAALVFGIEAVFIGLKRVLPVSEQTPSQVEQLPSSSADEASNPAPSFCTHCGKELPETFQWGQFCPYCGTKVEWAAESGSTAG